MESSLLSARTIDRKKVIGELIRGRKSAQELEVLLRNTPESDDIQGPRMASAHLLVKRILDSYNRNLSNIGSWNSEEDSEVPAVDSPSLDGRRKSEDSADNCKTTCVLQQDRRGSYKRRRTSERCIRLSSTWIDDGHAWRKYGQKSIQNTSHPRSYFRCTHKFDQGCPATKHVQQIEDNPPRFKTIYYDHHTCKNPYKTAQVVIVDPIPEDNSSNIMLNFESPIEPNYERKDLVKQVANDNAIPSDYFISPHHFTNYGQASEALTGFSAGSDYGDVYSCTTSTHSMDMDHLIFGPPFQDDDFLEY